MRALPTIAEVRAAYAKLKRTGVKPGRNRFVQRRRGEVVLCCPLAAVFLAQGPRPRLGQLGKQASRAKGLP